MPNEIELKFRVKDFQDVRKLLAEARAEYLGTLLVTDQYYDAPGQTLRGQDIGLRLREVQHLDGPDPARDLRPELTFKGPADLESRAKIREEVQTRVDDVAAVERAFSAAGLTGTMKVQKRRESYRLGGCLVELDELPLLGCFVEVEAPDEPALEAVEKQLALTGPMKDHYVALAARACRERGLDTRELMFETVPVVKNVRLSQDASG